MHTKADGGKDSADEVETHDVLLTQNLKKDIKSPNFKLPKMIANIKAK
jgi:hypothetical protein